MVRAFDVVMFDFGGVFTSPPFIAAENVARSAGVDISQFVEVMFGVYHLDTDHPWHRLERGEISFESARSEIIALGEAAGMEVDPVSFLSAMISKNPVRDSMVECARAIKAAGFATAIVTNNVREFRDGWRALVPIDEFIDRVFDSSELGIRKPNPAIYQYALCEMDCTDATRAIFLDDVEQNVLSAGELGIQAIHVKADPSCAIERLRVLTR